ncbi:hypothetical protein F5X98DRAFT_67277 [Xylaria grammica]|nr:hypothetical protein F5X98DRAFT_67277 [Xylaria grammica]
MPKKRELWSVGVSEPARRLHPRIISRPMSLPPRILSLLSHPPYSLLFSSTHSAFLIGTIILSPLFLSIDLRRYVLSVAGSPLNYFFILLLTIPIINGNLQFVEDAGRRIFFNRGISREVGRTHRRK